MKTFTQDSAINVRDGAGVDVRSRDSKSGVLFYYTRGLEQTYWLSSVIIWR